MKHARGHNELKPISLTGHQPFVLGSLPMGATIVDALDTLYMMNLEEEFNEARNYVVEELNFDQVRHISGGMFVLGATGPQDPWFQRGVEITRTCNYTYAASVTQLGPESFTFGSGVEGVPLKSGHKAYLLRPETVESYFYLWRFTKDEAYRIAALKVVQVYWLHFFVFKALEKYARTAGGYSGLKDVNSPESGHDDVQQSFFIAETLKYLYLIFSEDTLFPLNRWVFNSEGHPLPVHNEVWLGNDIWPKPFAQPTSCSRLSGN
ncbi:glycosyl hydrolase family 47 [Opisthorchis viverrini]|uniref:Glycosyl hydrolase family 47 n=1 Tax=Opisthorchis viverrini TaxID=6198 RepID=A0A1S8X6Q4_OPIVI|nr:glycosyl hydrolase family 47 [Opisthorchis viverrini]